MPVGAGAASLPDVEGAQGGGADEIGAWFREKTKNFRGREGDTEKRMKDIINTGVDMNFLFIFAVLLSFIVSYLTIKYFLIYVRNFNLNLFVYYRTFLALILFVIAYS